MELCIRYLSYDPNYNYDDENDDGDDAMDQGDNDNDDK